MTIGLKDIIYLIGYILSLMAILFSIRNQLRSNEREINKVSSILFGDRGKLNVVDIDSCKQNRDAVFKAIRRAEMVNEMLLKKMEDLNNNVTIIMVYMGLTQHKLKEFNEKISLERTDTGGIE